MLTWSTVLRRRHQPSPPADPLQLIQTNGVAFDTRRQRALIDGHVVYLPAREAAVLGLLMARAGQTVHRAALAQAAGHRGPPAGHKVDRLIDRLCRRLQPSPLSPARLHRISETGYLFGIAAHDELQ
jgi:DNA-binding response OmpR family regulator